MSEPYLLDGYKPRAFMRAFEDIAHIPHGSGNEAGVARYIMDLAMARGLTPEPDEHGNVLIRVPASAGCEQVPPVLFQAHMDMVCAKDPGVAHDFTRDPLELYVDGDDVLYARGTTLGADNAVGVCLMLALMQEPDFVHPPLELLFTVEEESGLIGIRKFDFSKLKARRMVNMDCGDADVMCICCAGVLRCRLVLPLARRAYAGLKCTLSVDHLVGGHAGLRIGEGHANAVNLMGLVLRRLRAVCPLQVERVDSPTLSGIPTDCTAVVALPAQELEAAQAAAAALQQELRAHYGALDPEITITLTPSGEGAPRVLDGPTADALLRLLCGIGYGATHLDEDGVGVITSCCTLRMVTSEDELELCYSIRSAIDSEKWEQQKIARALCESCGARLEVTDEYTSWPVRPDSPIQALCKETYRALFGTEIKIVKSSGTNETGVLVGALPDMDAMGIAPTGRGAHTPTEHLYLREVEPVWRLFLAMLERMCR